MAVVATTIHMMFAVVIDEVVPTIVKHRSTLRRWSACVLVCIDGLGVVQAVFVSVCPRLRSGFAHGLAITYSLPDPH